MSFVRLQPCGCLSCVQASQLAELRVCPQCGQHVQTVREAPQAALTADIASSNLNRDNWRDAFNINRNRTPATPTPAPRALIPANTSTATSRYVPPPLRTQPTSSPEIRPESRMSNKSFASQPPQPPGLYSYDPVPPPRELSELRLFGRQGASRQNEVTRPTPSMMSTNWRNTEISPASSTSETDSRAYQLAQLIKSGAMDDPRDIDYGNPGPSRRNPVGEPDPTIPMPCGKIVAGNDARKEHTSSAPNTKGNAAVFADPKVISLPMWFDQVPMGFTPYIHQIFEVMPLVEPCRVAVPSTAGVVRMTNVPYASAKSEVIALFGRHAKIVSQPAGTPYLGVHLVMDRLSGKSMDVLVEVADYNEAKLLVAQFAQRNSQRRGKIGNREVEVKLSSSAELMAEMFPRGKNLSWKGNRAVIDPRLEEYYPGKFSTGFIGFLSSEELSHMVIHAETPQRSAFAQRCLIRVYECMISTLHKYPWYDVDHVFVHEVNALFETARSLIVALINMLQKEAPSQKHDPTRPTKETLKELVVATLTCPGFPDKMKTNIIAILHQGGCPELTRPEGMNVHFGGTDARSREWPFFTLMKNPGAPPQLVEYLFHLLRTAIGNANSPIFAPLNIGSATATNIGAAGRAERDQVESMLRAVLPTTGSNIVTQTRSPQGSNAGSNRGSNVGSNRGFYGVSNHGSSVDGNRGSNVGSIHGSNGGSNPGSNAGSSSFYSANGSSRHS